MSQEKKLPFAPAPLVGQTFEAFGNYLLLKKLECGGMAEIFLARPADSKANGRVQVIKRILPQISKDPVFARMFQTEVQVMMGFSHPHTVQLHDFGHVGDQPFIAMEYIEGKNLRHVANQFGKKGEVMPVPMILNIIAQAAAGLAYTHSYANPVTGEVVNAIHRDISPQNLLISYDGHVKVIDFGIAKSESPFGDRTENGIIKGKVAYLSPEQIRGLELDGRTDIFSLAIVAWELLTFRRPFCVEGGNELSVLKKIERSDQVLVPPSTYNKEIPPAVDAVIMKALRNNRDERYPTASAFQEAIRQVVREHFPNYSYTDTGSIMTALFEKEIASERAELRLLNERAQGSLIREESLSSIKRNARGHSGSVPRPMPVIPHPHHQEQWTGGSMEIGRAEVESLLRQKATGKHYAFFGLYLLSIVALKLDDRYGLLDHFIGPSTRVEASTLAQNQRSVMPANPAASMGSLQPTAPAAETLANGRVAPNYPPVAMAHPNTGAASRGASFVPSAASRSAEVRRYSQVEPPQRPARSAVRSRHAQNSTPSSRLRKPEPTLPPAEKSASRTPASTQATQMFHVYRKSGDSR